MRVERETLVLGRGDLGSHRKRIWWRCSASCIVWLHKLGLYSSTDYRESKLRMATGIEVALNLVAAQ